MTVMPNPMLSDRFVRAVEFAERRTRDPGAQRNLHSLSGAPARGRIPGHRARRRRGHGDRGPAPRCTRGSRRTTDAGAGAAAFRREGGKHRRRVQRHLREEKPAYGTRKTAYVEHLAGDASIETCLVSAADKLHNARAILHDLRAAKEPIDFWARFSGSPAGIGWYFGRVEHALTAAACRSTTASRWWSRSPTRSMPLPRCREARRLALACAAVAPASRSRQMLRPRIGRS